MLYDNLGSDLLAPRKFSVTCGCGAEGPDEIQDALAEGWRNIEADDDQDATGICPECW